jgi:hypothetical protein
MIACEVCVVSEVLCSISNGHYTEELKQKEKKVAMKIIFHTWRTYKSKLVKIWRDQETPFDKYKDLTKEDWSRFVEKCESKHFGANTQYTQWL